MEQHEEKTIKRILYIRPGSWAAPAASRPSGRAAGLALAGVLLISLAVALKLLLTPTTATELIEILEELLPYLLALVTPILQHYARSGRG